MENSLIDTIWERDINDYNYVKYVVHAIGHDGYAYGYICSFTKNKFELNEWIVASVDIKDLKNNWNQTGRR